MLLLRCVAVVVFALTVLPGKAGPWPVSTEGSRPWTRWWWLGSAVDKEGLTRELEGLREAGFGGVEITAIYGVRGQENRHIDYLSERWLEMLEYTCAEARRLGLGVDLPPGSGWRCGGPHVPKEESACFFALAEDGKSLAVRQGREHVKRPAPGGAGLTIDVYGTTAAEHYLDRFNRAVTSVLPAGAVRAQFHDSFEYGGDWSPQLPEAFLRQHGYAVTDHLDVLGKARKRETLGLDGRRVVYDYRRTLEEMYLAGFLGTWNRMSHERGMLTRNQGHGTPANILDVYAAADIPETEIFRDTVNPLVNLLASSAAHVAGRQRISCESFTWLSEHFQSDLGRLKEFTDYLFLCGVNHVVYHGTAYSPADAAWPGWLFYASSQINPRNPIWRDLPALNTYMARCQAVLRIGRPDHDVLLFWPIDDDWMRQDGFRSGFSIDGGHWRVGNGFRRTAQTLWDAGVLFDYVSDRQLAAAQAKEGRIAMPGGEYRALVLPPFQFLRPETAASVLRLARAGVPVVSLASVKEMDVPGRARLEARQASLRESVTELGALASYREGEDVMAMLAQSGVSVEKLPGGRYERRRWDDGSVCYLLVNRTKSPVREWVAFPQTGSEVSFLDPWTGRTGWVPRRADGTVLVTLAPGESRFVVIGKQRLVEEDWRGVVADQGRALQVARPWQVSFVVGGPVRPVARRVARLTPYTSWPEQELERFAGTARYETELSLEAAQAQADWLLDLGQVHGSARVWVNGQMVGVGVRMPYRFLVPQSVLHPDTNHLAVEVTSVAANRIRDLDRRGVKWRIFHDINFVNREYQKFNASDWPTVPAGLVGPVQLLGVRAEQ